MVSPGLSKDVRQNSREFFDSEKVLGEVNNSNRVLELSVNYQLRIIFIATLVGLTVSCTTTATSSSDTFVRISNQSGVALSRLNLGRRIIKANSYSNKNYVSSFSKVNDGDVTGYRALKETHFGLDRFLVAADRGGYTGMTRFKPIDAPFFQKRSDGLCASTGKVYLYHYA